MSTANEMADRLEIFFGATSEAVCRVYARLEVAHLDGPVTLTGTLSGPTCRYAETLPAAFTFVDRGPGQSLLAEAIVPEPCFWTPALPHLYQAELQVRQADNLLTSVKRLFGIRPLGVSARQLVYSGRSWVLRGVASGELPKTDLAAWRDSETAMLADTPDDVLCETASRVGVLIVAHLNQPDIREIRRITKWPAVGTIAWSGAEAPDEIQAHRRNAMLAQRFAAGEPPRPAPWADVAMCNVATGATPPEGFADCQIPLIALRPAGHLESLAAGRGACDRLQRDLAPYGQFAGYIV